MSESADLSAMKLVELKSVASGLGIKGTSAMRKGDLVDAIQAKGNGAPAGAAAGGGHACFAGVRAHIVEHAF